MPTLLRLARGHLRPLGAATVFAIVAVICWLLIPIFVKRLIDDAILAKDASLVWPLGLAVLGIGVVQAFVVYRRRDISASTAVAIERDLRSRLVNHLHGVPPAMQGQWRTGDVLTRATSDLHLVGGFLGNSLVFLIAHALTSAGVAIMLFRLDAVLAALTLGLTIPTAAVAHRFNDKMRTTARRSRAALADLTSTIEESIAGITVLQGFGGNHATAERHAAAAERLKAVKLESAKIRANYIGLFALGPSLVLAAVLGAGGLRVINGDLSLGGLVAFNQYLALILIPLRVAARHLSMAQQAGAAAARVQELLDVPLARVSRLGARELPAEDGHVEFVRVFYAYPAHEEFVLTDVSLSLSAGEIVAVVGPSGSGKSTIGSLLHGMDNPALGCIRIDGFDIRSATLQSLRNKVAVVFDEPMLFSGSIHDNIAFGAPGASEDDVRHAAHVAGIEDFVASLPHGYNSEIGEQGVWLSAGQRQRIALARAVLPDPRILVLDDPFSNVDLNTEEEITTALRPILARRTTLLLTHRASTIAMADRIICLEAGRVSASGSHAQLLATSAAYRRILGFGRTEDVA